MTDAFGVDTQQYKLARAIPVKFHEKKPGTNATYVPHFVVEQILLATVGAFDWELVEILRGYVPQWKSKDGKQMEGPFLDSITGCVYRMTVTIDGRRVVIEEVGQCDAGAYDNNDGARLKKAASDALKRCAMRLGVGLHLWCKKDMQFFLPAYIRDQAAADADADGEVVVGTEEQEDDD